MRVPTLRQACYKHYRSTVVKACPFCRDVQCPEQVLCDLVRQGLSEKQPLQYVHGSGSPTPCVVLRPALAACARRRLRPGARRGWRAACQAAARAHAPLVGRGG
jgi:hypothetical protein